MYRSRSSSTLSFKLSAILNFQDISKPPFLSIKAQTIQRAHWPGEWSVPPGFKGKSECKNTCAPGSSYTHASTQWIPKHSVKCKESIKQLLHDRMSQLTTVRVANSEKTHAAVLHRQLVLDEKLEARKLARTRSLELGSAQLVRIFKRAELRF
jgi:hypothetical protein